MKAGFSQFITAPSASYSLSTAYTNGTPNDAIFGFCTPNSTGAAVTGSLTATAGIANCSFVWTLFNAATNSYGAYATQTGLTSSTITGLASGGYHVTIKNSAGTVVGCDLVWVWINQTNATVAPLTAGCSPFSLNGTASAVSNYTYYNPAPEPLLINNTTTITVCFNATHTYVSDLGFFLVGPASCGSPVVTLSPNPGSNGQNNICNSGNNVNNLCFTTLPSPNFNPCTAGTPYSGTFDSYGVNPGTPINWSSLYGCDAAAGGWKVQIYDCIGADVGALTHATITFQGNSGCGPSSVSYNSGNINSAINDNSCSGATASIYNVPAIPAVSPIVINNTITYQWTSLPATTIPNSTTSLSPAINPIPTIDTWYYLSVIDNFGCRKKDSAFFDYSPPGTPTVTAAGPFCVNAPSVNLSATPAGGAWSGAGITNTTNGTFNPATAGVGTFTVAYTTPGACGTSKTTTIVVNASPTVTVPANITVCNGVAVPVSTFTANPAGSGISWTNNTTSIGLGSNGNGTIPSFTGINTGSTPVTAVISVTPSLNGCTGTPVSYSITVNPTPVLNAVTSQTVCHSAATAPVSFVTVPAGATVNWTNSNPSIGLGANGTGTISSFTGTNTTASAISGNFSATPTLAGCVGTPVTFTITVSPMPVLSAIPGQTLCAGVSTSPVNFVTNPAGATIAWSNSNSGIGTGASGNGNIPSFTTTNSTATQQSGNFSATPTLNTCVGTAQTFTISVKPTPVLSPVASQTICGNGTTAAINFTSTPAGATVNWSNTATGTGLAASGAGNIPSFTGQTPGTVVTSVITVTPSLTSCTGLTVTFSITVNPTPTLTAVASQTVCEGSAVNGINFTSNPAGATINWANSSTAIGLPASGSGNIAGYNASNGTGAIVNAAFTATPSIGTCTGAPVSFTITVKPAVTTGAVAGITVCSGVAVPASTFTSTPAGATFSWTNSNTGTGLPANGTGNYASFTSTNTTANPLISVISVTPSLNGCSGPAIQYSITVNPTPLSPTVTNVAYCLNDAAAALTATTSTGGTLNWWGTNASGGTSSASGPIPSTSAIATTTYYVSQTVAGCESPRAPLQVNVGTLPSVTDPIDLVVCAGDLVPLQAFPTTPLGASISWANTNTSIGLAASGSGNVPSFTALNSGQTPVVAAVTVTPGVGSCVGAPITYSITVKPLPSVTVTDINACDNSAVPSISWTSTPAGAGFAWSNSNPAIGTSANGTGNIPSFTAINGSGAPVIGIVTVIPTLNSCTGSSSSFTITINPTPAAPLATGLAYCQNDVSAPLTATGSGLLWYSTTTGGAGSGLAPTPSTANVGTLTAYVSQTIFGCEGPRTLVTTTVNALPLADLQKVTAKCPPLCTDLVITSTSVLNAYNWTLGDGSTFIGNDTIKNHCYQAPGSYSVSVTITDNNNCRNTIAYPNAVQVYDLPDAQFNSTPNPATLLDPTVTFTSTSLGTPPLRNDWNFGDNSIATDQNGPVHVYQNAGSYVVQLTTTNRYGCVDIIESTIIIENDFTLYIPNSFTPNGDGLNEGFSALGLGIETEGFKMSIFDRWGELIFSTDDITKPWPGTVKGKNVIAKSDVYVWKIEFKTVTGKQIQKLGHVTLLP